jgi:hypothetical protein
MASARLSVVKLFDFGQRDDAGRQFDSGRRNEYLLWCARMKGGARGEMPDFDCPRAGWIRLRQRDEDSDRESVQHADKGDLRAVADPDYVDSYYDYVVRSDDDPAGWVSGCGTAEPLPPEDFRHDPDAGGGTSTPR